MNRCYTNYNNFRHKCRLNVNSPSKCKSCIMCVRLKRLTYLFIWYWLNWHNIFVFLFTLTKLNCCFWFYNKTYGIILFLLKKMHFTYLYHNVITRNYRKSHSKLFTMFFYGCQIRHKFVHKKLVCEFINHLVVILNEPKIIL